MDRATLTAEGYDRIAADYDQGYVGPFWELYELVTIESIARLLTLPGMRVLDVGGGSGRFTMRMIGGGHEVILLDISRGMVERARDRFRAAERALGAEAQGGIESLPFATGSFDVVVAEGDPLCYCLDHEQAVREMLRVLKPGGKLYVSVDNRWLAAYVHVAAGRVAECFAAMREGRSTDPYALAIHAFDQAELAALIARCGGVDVEVAGKICVAHLMPPSKLGLIWNDAAQRDALLSLERAMSRQPAGGSVATHLHAIASKPGGAS